MALWTAKWSVAETVSSEALWMGLEVVGDLVFEWVYMLGGKMVEKTDFLTASSVAEQSVQQMAC